MATKSIIWKRTLFGSALAMVFMMGTAASAPVSLDIQLLDESAGSIFTVDAIETQAWTGTCGTVESESDAAAATCVELPGRLFTVRVGPSADTRYLIVGPADNKRPDMTTERALIVGPTDNLPPELSIQDTLIVGATDNRNSSMLDEMSLVVGPTDNRNSSVAKSRTLVVGPTDNRNSSVAKSRTLVVGPTDNKYRTLDSTTKESVAASLLDASGQDSPGIWLVVDIVADSSFCVILDLESYRGGPVLANEHTSVAAELGLFMVELGVAPTDIDLAELARVALTLTVEDRSMETAFDAAEEAVALWMDDACYEAPDSELVGQICSALR